MNSSVFSSIETSAETTKKLCFEPVELWPLDITITRHHVYTTDKSSSRLNTKPNKVMLSRVVARLFI